MGIRLAFARTVGAASTWGLKHIFHRPAANFPGKVGLYVDPQLIGDLAGRVRKGSVAVVGTNGKTTVTNLLADAFEQSGKTVSCNRTGANLDSGVATALLHTKSADWGVFESDELWLAKITPALKPRYVLLLNLFRDQLDRMGEIDHIQESIVKALTSSPETVLVYNADDPLCQAIANWVENVCVPFGVGEDMGLAQNTVADAGMCQMCEAGLVYKWRQYGQLGDYHCPNCGFCRSDPVYRAHDIKLSSDASTFSVRSDQLDVSLTTPFSSAYMVYNTLALYTVSDLCGIPVEAVMSAINSFDPKNGRLQTYDIDGVHVLLNLAKNPTGFNQNLDIVLQAQNPAVAFYINDKEADGHDVSWLWDVDFQKLAGADGLHAFAGGIRSHDMQVRLKYAGMEVQLVEGARDFLAKAKATCPGSPCYLIANYTVLPKVKAELDELAKSKEKIIPNAVSAHETIPIEKSFVEDKRHLTIVHMYPTLLNLYGDGGNVVVLEKRARDRGIDVEVIRVEHGEHADLENADIVFLGGGPDREQHLASRDLLEQADELKAYVEDDGVLLAICGGYQILGHTWLLGEESVPGLGIVDIVTKRAEGGSHNRLVGNIALQSKLANAPIVGYENHAGRTFVGDGCEPFGKVIGHHGYGNNDNDKADGVLYKNVIGTYLHGPLLSKNPEVADWLIQQALDRQVVRQGLPPFELSALDDKIESEANAFMCVKLGIR